MNLKAEVKNYLELAPVFGAIYLGKAYEFNFKFHNNI
jgi:hypothetical protein